MQPPSCANEQDCFREQKSYRKVLEAINIRNVDRNQINFVLSGLRT